MEVSLFSGCSYTAGSGFKLEKKDPALWVNLLHGSHPKLNKTKLLNVSHGGASNETIFRKTIFNILTIPEIKYVFVQWSSVPRYEMSLGLETYNTHQSFIPRVRFRQHNLHEVIYKPGYLKKINDRFTSLANDHYEIVNLLMYVNSINLLCKLKKCQVFYINGLCPWDHDYFKKLDNVLPCAYTDYTKKLIQTETRDDEEVFKIYDKIHKEYNEAGGILEHRWLNLYMPMDCEIVDVNDDHSHPGIESNYNYYQKFSQALDFKITDSV